MAVPCSVYKAFSHLESSSNTSIFEALLEIRKFVAKSEDNIKILREKHVLENLVILLGKANEKILDITLSILGNCCLEYESREEVSRHGIVQAVSLVLSSTNRDSIQGRACRLISNLALTSHVAVQLHKEKVVSNLVNVVDLEGKFSSASRQMAIRALRILWSVESERGAMLRLHVVHKVAVLLSTPYEKKEHKELLKAVVKALAVFTHHCTDLCAYQVHAGDSGFRCLLSLCRHHEIKESAFVCVYNLCRIENSRPVLGNAGTVKLIIKELSQRENFKEELTDREIVLVSTLCLLCRESVNRAKIRRRGGLPIILSVFRDSPNSALKMSSLQGLTQFVFDELSLVELLKEGIVNVLVEKLTNIVTNHGFGHEIRPLERNSKKRHCSLTSDFLCSVQNTPVEKDTVDPNENCTSNIESPIKSKEPNQTSEVMSNTESWKRFRVCSPSYQEVVQEISCSQRYRYKSVADTSPANSSDSAYRSASPEYLANGEPCSTSEWSPGSSKSFCFSPAPSPPYSRLWNPSPPVYQMMASPSFDVWSSSSSPASHSSVDGDFADVLYSPVYQDDSSDDEMSSADLKCNALAPTVPIPEATPLTIFGSGWGSSETPSDSVPEPKSPEVLASLNPPESLDEEIGILILLSRISHIRTAVEELGDNRTLMVLINSIKLMEKPKPRAYRILSRIITAHHYFPQILIHQFALNVYDILCQRTHTSCEICEAICMFGQGLMRDLVSIAESGLGEGELSYHLLKADNCLREQLAVTIPFIVKAPRLLKKLLLDCKALDILERLVQSYPEQESDVFKYIPTALSFLASSLYIAEPFLITATENSTISGQQVSEDTDNICNVIFLLDNGDTVGADKKLLCEHSPVFEAMFRGDFKESEQETIRLQDISLETFLNVVYLMKLGKIPKYLPDISIASAMELVLMLDRFLIPGSKELSDLIIKQFVQPQTICDVYVNACTYMGVLKEIDNIRLRAVQFLLVSEMDMKKRTDIFSKLLKGTCSLQIQKEIFSMIHDKLRNWRYLVP